MGDIAGAPTFYPLSATVRVLQAFVAIRVQQSLLHRLASNCVVRTHARCLQADVYTRVKAHSVGLELAKSDLVVTWYEVKSLLIDRRGCQYYDAVQLTAASEDRPRQS